MTVRVENEQEVITLAKYLRDLAVIQAEQAENFEQQAAQKVITQQTSAGTTNLSSHYYDMTKP